MAYPLVLTIGLRYIKAKCDNRYVSFLSLFSILATGLGVAVLITVMSVMNGFDFEIKKLIQDTGSHVTITTPNSYIDDWKTIANKLASNNKNISEIEPTIELQSLLNKDMHLAPVLVSGVTNEKLNKQYKKLKNKKFGIIITQSYAAKLDANINDDVLLVTPVLRSTITGLRPEMHKFNIVDIIPNTKFIPQQIVRLEDMQKILSVGKRVSNINIRLKDLDDGPSLAKNLRNDNSFFYSVSSWADRYSQLFKALSLQKTMMFLILMLIIVIAAFNMLSSMVMLVTDKQNSIAVLRTLGLRKYQVIFIFILQGTILGLIGMALGTALGITISNNVTPIVHGIESILGYKLVDKSVYMLDYLPVKISYMDVIIINITALTLSILATIYPSIKAATISPGKVLKGVL